jgi:hypothetical protein
MAHEPMPIARVRLARSLPRVLALPAALVLLAAAAGTAAWLAGGAVEVSLGVLAGALIASAAAVAILPLTLHLEVEVGGLRVRWLGGGRRYRLVPGAVTRAPMRAPGERVIRTRFRILGWAYGSARLRGSERISIIRLARTPTVILVPTDHGRLAIGAASEAELLEALGAAARVQQRLDEVSGRVRAALPEPPAREVEHAPAPVSSEAVAPDAGPRVMTGIERARLEAELAAARAAALREAEAERAAATPAGDAAPPAGAAVEVSRPPAAKAETPPWVRLRAPRIGAPARAGWASERPTAVRVSIALALLPLAASLVGFFIAGGSSALVYDNVPTRLLATALVACGPAAALGVLIARAWWPRLAGLVATSAVVAVVLLARATMG